MGRVFNSKLFFHCQRVGPQLRSRKYRPAAPDAHLGGLPFETSKDKPVRAGRFWKVVGAGRDGLKVWQGLVGTMGGSRLVRGFHWGISTWRVYNGKSYVNDL